MPAEPRRRHNGVPQACEPCRKSKIRCDHQSPKCSRCVSRNLDCVYHPAPMTKRRLPSNFETTAYEPPVLEHPIESPHTTSAEYSLPSASDHSVGFSNGYKTPKRNTLFQKGIAQHETTRYSAVFFENQDSFGPVIDDVTSSSSYQEPGQELDDRRSEYWPRMDLAVNTLLNFPTARTCERLVQGIHYIYDVWVSPTMIQQCLDQVWREYGNCLGENRTRESVSRMAHDLFLNDKRPRATPDNDFDGAGWMNWFAGPWLRWEMIGILFSWAGMAFRHRQEWDSVFDLPEQQGRNRNSAAERMRECASACVKLCEDNFEVSDIMVICMKNSIKLQSIIISDESKLRLLTPWSRGTNFVQVIAYESIMAPSAVLS